MKTYESFQVFEIPCVGIIPSRWIKSRFKFHHQEVDIRVGENSNDFTLLSLTKKGIIIRDVDSGKGKFPASFNDYKEVNNGDIVFCLYDIEETPRTVGLSHNFGMITGSYKVFTTDSVIPEFSTYFFLSIDDVKGLKPFYTGLRNVVRPETFKSLPFPLPPLAEQQQIVAFLDQKTADIDSLIDKTQQKIQLLKEKRTALINHVVTKGLNPDVEMKDSGVEWIGEIPKGWMVSKFKYDSSTPVQYGINISSDKYVEGGIRFIRITDISDNGDLNPEDGKYLVPDDVPVEFILREFDVLFCRSGHTVGKSYLHTNKGQFTSGGYLVRFNFRNYSESKFIFYLSKTDFYWDWIKLNTVVSTIENVNGDKYQNFIYPKPPLSEQQQIVKYLDAETQKIDATISNEEKRIELLKEYKQSLISEVVTGKRNVVD